MTEENRLEERKPFISFSFNEQGEFDRYAGIYLHVPLDKAPAPEEIAVLVGTIKTFSKAWAQLKEKLGLGEMPGRVPAPAETTPEAAGKPSIGVPAPNAADDGGRPPGGATEAQCRAILAIAHRLDANTVQQELVKYAGAEWKQDDEGHCIPKWDFLESLSKSQAGAIITKLGRAQA